MKSQGIPRERARRTRLLLRDGAATAAFGAMALSGHVPLVVTLIFLAAAILGVLDKRPLGKTGKLDVTLLLGTAVALAALVFFGALDLIIAAASFAGLLTSQRMASVPDPATDQQVHLSSLLMLAGGAALSGDLLFGVVLLIFTLLASLSMGLGVVEAAVPEGEPVPVNAVVGPLARGVAFALVGALAFFVFFPRMNWNMAARGTSSSLGQATTGFTDRVRLGEGQGTLKTNPRVVARAQLVPDPKSDALNRYWIGRTFDTFDGREWSVSERRRELVFQHGAASGIPRRARVTQKIELLPSYEGRTLVALEPVISVYAPRLQTSGGPQPTRFELLGGEEIRFADQGTGYLFDAVTVDPSTPRDAPELSPEQRARMLLLPSSLDPRIPALAKQLLGDERSPIAAARKLESHLKQNFTYSLELEGGVDDPLAHFLFDRKAGHCEHFASALTILLRSQGIPARLASGFYGGERVGEHYIIRAGDAHAWSQVFITGRGWVTVDATPESFRQGQPVALFAWAVGVYEWLENQWLQTVVDYDFRDQVDGVRTLVRPPKQDGVVGPRKLPPLRAWLVAAVAALGVYAAWRLGQKQTARVPRHSATKLHASLERVLTRAGIAPEAEGETLETTARKLRAAAHPIAPTLDRVTRRYLEARFGGRPLDPGEARHLVVTLERAVRAHVTEADRVRTS